MVRTVRGYEVIAYDTIRQMVLDPKLVPLTGRMCCAPLCQSVREVASRVWRR